MLSLFFFCCSCSDFLRSCSSALPLSLPLSSLSVSLLFVPPLLIDLSRLPINLFFCITSSRRRHHRRRRRRLVVAAPAAVVISSTTPFLFAVQPICIEPLSFQTCLAFVNLRWSLPKCPFPLFPLLPGSLFSPVKEPCFPSRMLLSVQPLFP